MKSTATSRSPPGSGSGESRTSAIASNTVAPTAMATAMANAANHRQPAILHEHPAAEFQVEHEGLEAGQAAAIAMGFPGAGNTADPDERLAARFVRCHAGADVVVRVQIDVALQLVGEVPLAGAGPNEAGDSRPPRAQRLVHGSVAFPSLRSPPGSAS